MNAEEQKLVERSLMTEEEFDSYLTTNRPLRRFEGVKKFKSTGRAIRRSNMIPDGTIVPNKPYNNRGNTCKRKGKHSREMNELKKDIYGKFRRFNSKG